MAYIGAHDLNEEPIYFSYRRISVNDQHKETFHSHRGTEILWIHQGYGTMIVNNISYDIRPGMICVFQPYQLHHLKLDYSNNRTFERSIAIFEPTMFDRYFEQWPLLHNFYKSINSIALLSPCIYGVEQHEELETLFHNMQQKLLKLTDAEQLEEISLFLVLLFRSLKPLWPKQQEPLASFRTRKHQHVEQMLGWIERHYTMPFDLDRMAKELHISSSHLSHRFKELVGISITEYIATRRMHQAILLLTTTDKPVAWIAEQIGITNNSYFCKFFKLRMGATPHQYRKRWGN